MYSRELAEGDYAIVLASDGIWDVLSADKVGSIISSCGSISGAALAKRLEQEATSVWETVRVA